jgi:hypothetical protein
MIALFTPVRNDYGFDIREIYFDNKGKVKVKKYLKVSEYIDTDDMAVFKPQTCFKNKQDYQEQFIGFNEEKSVQSSFL